MRPAQAELLRQLIEAEHQYWIASASGQPVINDNRGVEIGKINGHNPKTADSLRDAGLIEIVDIHGTGRGYAFLGRYIPSEEPLR